MNWLGRPALLGKQLVPCVAWESCSPSSACNLFSLTTMGPGEREYRFEVWPAAAQANGESQTSCKIGTMAEWLNAPVLKTGDLARGPWVQILLVPLKNWSDGRAAYCTRLESESPRKGTGDSNSSHSA